MTFFVKNDRVKAISRIVIWFGMSANIVRDPGHLDYLDP